MIIVESVSSKEEAESCFPKMKKAVITMSWEERRWSHGKNSSDCGIPFAISLPTGTVLQSGDCFVLEEKNILVQVQAAKEPVYILEPKKPQEWAYWAYQIGNRHQTLMITKDKLICLQEVAVKMLLDQLNIPYLLGDDVFTPAVNVSGHSH
jgi:urease accessory protein UreE